MKIFENIDELKKLMQDSLDSEAEIKELDGIERVIRENLTIEALKNQPGVAVLLKLLKLNIELADDQLKEKEDISERERDRLFARRGAFREIWGLFENAEAIIKTKEQEVEKILENNKEFLNEKE